MSSLDKQEVQDVCGHTALRARSTEERRMSSLDKQEIQDVCGHTALRATKWSRFVFKRASEDMRLSR